jgi:hypothetical protein
VSSTKGVIIFYTSGKLSPWYVRPFMKVPEASLMPWLSKSMKGLHAVSYVYLSLKHFHDLEMTKLPWLPCSREDIGRFLESDEAQDGKVCNKLSVR